MAREKHEADDEDENDADRFALHSTLQGERARSNERCWSASGGLALFLKFLFHVAPVVLRLLPLQRDFRLLFFFPF